MAGSSSAQQSGDWIRLGALVAGVVLLGVLAGAGWVVIILALVAMLFLHELGHFVTARLTGMKVSEFFIGFGPRLWSFRRGETEYGIKAIWIGAYVRIVGMNNLDQVDPGDEPRTFRQQSYPRKLLVLTAGSGMHFIIVVLLLFAVLLSDGRVAGRASEALDNESWVLSTVSPDSAAAAAGLRPGDELVSVAGVARSSFDDFSVLVQQLAGRQVEVLYRRDGADRSAFATVGERLTAEGAAGITGLIEGDRILAVEGLQADGAPTYSQLVEYGRDRIGEPLDITIVDTRTGRPAVVEDAVVTALAEPADAVRGFFGVSAEFRAGGLGVFGAAEEALRQSLLVIRDVLVAIPAVVTDGLGGTFDGLRGDDPPVTGTQAARELELRRLDSSHPDENRILSIYGVARIGAEVASDSFSDVLLLLVYVNAFIGVFNLLPLLPLDGGHVVVATYERIRSFGGRVHRVDAARLLPGTYAFVALLRVVGGGALL
ncbi:MAG: site-2 protease family protein, partial [Acidimicrobiaceae bacterium]|nr:site-2 protease family protein [Acidimicrobiaceae bacterium]